MHSFVRYLVQVLNGVEVMALSDDGIKLGDAKKDVGEDILESSTLRHGSRWSILL